MKHVHSMLVRIFTVLTFLSGAFIAIPGLAAHAAGCSDQTWPRSGSLQTSNWPGSNQYAATLQFTLSQSELCALQQAGPYLEIDFAIRNFNVPAAWEGYSITSTNLPGAIHDVAFMDPQYEANPAVTRIYTSRLQVGKTYYATLTWTANRRSGMTPYIYFVWTPSHWAMVSDPYVSASNRFIEVPSCINGGNSWAPGDVRNPNEAWCIFPYGQSAVTLFGNKTFAGGFPSGALPLDGFRWYDWSLTVPAVYSASTSTVRPAPAPPSNLSVGGMISLATDQLRSGTRMYPNQYILSLDGRYVLTLQGDGNLVLYGPGYQPLWSTGTGGKSVDSLAFQSDGNVVLYGTGSQGALWATNTVGSGGAFFKVQEDGNVVLYTSNGVSKWSLGINQGTTGGAYISTDTLSTDQWLRPGQYIKSADGRYVLYMQNDGNLVMWSPGKRQMWCSCTTHAGVEGLLVQGDGNLVLYGHGGYWATNTVGGAGPFKLVLQNDGNLVLYGGNGPRWATNTVGKI